MSKLGGTLVSFSLTQSNNAALVSPSSLVIFPLLFYWFHFHLSAKYENTSKSVKLVTLPSSSSTSSPSLLSYSSSSFFSFFSFSSSSFSLCLSLPPNQPKSITFLLFFWVFFISYNLHMSKTYLWNLLLSRHTFLYKCCHDSSKKNSQNVHSA